MTDPMAEDEVYKRALQFANDCGEQALGERDFDKIKQLYMEFATDIERYTTNKIIEELQKIDTGQMPKNIPFPPSVVTNNHDNRYYGMGANFGRYLIGEEVRDRIAELKALNHRKDD